MRKPIAILLLFSFIFGDSIHVNLLHFPALVAHYRYHQNHDGTGGFGNFIKMHYCDDHGDSPMHRVHNSLPFKSLQHVASFQMLCYDIPSIPTIVGDIGLPYFESKHENDRSLLYSGYPISLFHPPCFC